MKVEDVALQSASDAGGESALAFGDAHQVQQVVDAVAPGQGVELSRDPVAAAVEGQRRVMLASGQLGAGSAGST